MGKIYREITVERRLSATLKKAKARARKKGKRPREDPTTITVRDMQMGAVAGGKFYVRSSNLAQVPLGAGWSGNAQERLNTRRRDGDGEAKGRILYGVLETTNRPPVTIAALMFHYEKPGEIVVTHLEATSELTDYRADIFVLLTLAADRVALETSKAARAKLFLEVPRKDAWWFKEKLGFRESGPASQKSRVVLSREPSAAEVRKAQRVRG